MRCWARRCQVYTVSKSVQGDFTATIQKFADCETFLALAMLATRKNERAVGHSRADLHAQLIGSLSLDQLRPERHALPGLGLGGCVPMPDAIHVDADGSLIAAPCLFPQLTVASRLRGNGSSSGRSMTPSRAIQSVLPGETRVRQRQVRLLLWFMGCRDDAEG